MKIVHLCLSCFYIDNYSYQENMLPKYHVKMGHDVTVIASLVSFNKDGKPCLLKSASEYFDKDGYKVIRLEYKSPNKLYKTLRKYEGFYETLENERPDIIFSHGVSMADNSVLRKYFKKHTNVKLYADNHADYINSATNFLSKNVLHKIIWRHYAKKIEPYLTKCYGVTPMRCRFLKEMYHIDNNIIDFLPMGVDDESIPSNKDEIRNNIRKQFNIGEEDFLIFTGGKIDKRKNTHILIDVIKQLDNPKLHLVICGVLSPEMAYLKDKFNKNIHYLGWCNSEQVMNYMVASDCACFPGTHSTLWEQSVGVGLPCILKLWNEMTHMDINNNCIFVKGNDAEELQQVITKMLNKDFYTKLEINAKNAANSFLYSNIAKNAIELC
ncbi:MAG: glycosyltransferase family 4 protein [Paludibacteraceae bacterium]|nr:glycosyltransferase family 4 protein [Paludibacteraceae bacterium]